MTRTFGGSLAIVLCCALGAPACSDDPAAPGGAADAGGGGSEGGGGGGGGGTDGAAPGPGDSRTAGCPATADHELQIPLVAADFVPETSTSGANVEWSLVAKPALSVPAVGPGETLAVSIRLEGAPIVVKRDGRTLYATIVARTTGSTRASADLETTTGSTGELAPGAWQSSTSLDAGGRPIRITLGGIHVNPNEGESLGCFAVRATMPAQARSVSESTLVDVVRGGPLTIESVRFSVTGDAPETPFALGSGG